MGYWYLRHAFRNVEVSKELLKRLIDELDADENGRISMEEVIVAFKILWNKAMGKMKEPKPKKSKIRTVD